MDLSHLTLLATIVTALGAAVTAIATVFLWRVTRLLAVETERMSDASTRPQVVVTIEPNEWGMIYADLHVANTGNAAAFDVRINFDPALEIEDAAEGCTDVPWQTVSVIRPGQKLSSFIGAYHPLLETTYNVDVSWSRAPDAIEREGVRYNLRVADIKGVSDLGERNPLVAIANHLKKIRENWEPIAHANRRLEIDTFSAMDREDEKKRRANLRQVMQNRSNTQEKKE